MQKCFRNVLAAMPAAAGLAFVSSAVAQQPAGELTRKEWRAHIERAQSRLEQLRQDGKITEGSDSHSHQSAANREAREEWLAKVEAARKRVEELRASREKSEHEEIALKEDNPETASSQVASDDIRVGTLPPANMVRRQLSESGKVQRNGAPPSSRSEPTKQTGPDREQKTESRAAKQVRRSQRPAPAGGTVRDPTSARAMQISNAAVTTSSSSSCTSFWGCLKQAVGMR